MRDRILFSRASFIQKRARPLLDALPMIETLTPLDGGLQCDYRGLVARNFLEARLQRADWLGDKVSEQAKDAA